MSITDQLLVLLINEQRQYWYMWAKSKTEKGKSPGQPPDLIELPDPAPLRQSTKDALEKGRQEAKARDLEFGTIADVHRFLTGGM